MLISRNCSLKECNLNRFALSECEAKAAHLKSGTTAKPGTLLSHFCSKRSDRSYGQGENPLTPTATCCACEKVKSVKDKINMYTFMWYALFLCTVIMGFHRFTLKNDLKSFFSFIVLKIEKS